MQSRDYNRDRRPIRDTDKYRPERRHRDAPCDQMTRFMEVRALVDDPTALDHGTV
jgi:hypothetical protein